MFLLISLILSLCHSCLFAKPSVIIVGAGASGIAAATKLLEHDITNITILEAENGIGGRIHSVRFGQAFVDMGAEYCHGEKGNIVYELAKDFNILKPDLSTYNDKVYFSNGSKISLELMGILESVSNKYYGPNGKYEGYNTSGKSVGDAFRYGMESHFYKNHLGDAERSKLLKESLRFAEGMVIQYDGSFSWDDPSARSDYKDCEGDQGINWNGFGYKTILEILMKSFPDPRNKLSIDNKIYFNKKVTKIEWYREQLVTVKTQYGNIYKADHVIFTPSIGVLKHQKNTMFNPQLPSIKQYAIDAIGFGGVMKVIMYFPIKWWDIDNIGFFWREEDIADIDFQKGPSENGISWVVHFRNVAEAPNNPNVLIGWVSGKLVPEIETMPLVILKEGCNYVFTKFLSKTYNVTKIDRIMRSTWYSNDNFRGAYSFTRKGLYNEEFSSQKLLSEPLGSITGNPALLFAGEATNPVHYGTVHGAIETGFREAERIIKLQRFQ